VKVNGFAWVKPKENQSWQSVNCFDGNYATSGFTNGQRVSKRISVICELFDLGEARNDGQVVFHLSVSMSESFHGLNEFEK